MSSARHARNNNDISPYSRYSYDAANARVRSVTAPQNGGEFPGFESLKKAKKHTGRKVVLGILGVILLAVIIVAAVVGFKVHDYMTKLDSILEEGQPPMSTSVLTPTEADEPFYMLVLGVDTRDMGDLGPGAYSDAIMLVRIDMPNKQVTTVSIPRDTRWVMPDGTVEKINAAYFYGGVDSCVQAVEQKTGVCISHVMVFDVSDMAEIVDAIGGVEINVEVPMHKDILGTDQVISLEPGLQTLNGMEAEVYTRDRFAYETDQDANRQSNIRTLMEAVLHKVTKAPKSELPDMLMELAPYLHTDLRSMDFAKLGWQYFWSKSGDLVFYNGTAPSSGGIDEWYDDRWYCYENPQGWETLMSVVKSGGDPSSLDLEGTAITHEDRHNAEQDATDSDPDADSDANLNAA